MFTILPGFRQGLLFCAYQGARVDIDLQIQIMLHTLLIDTSCSPPTE